MRNYRAEVPASPWPVRKPPAMLSHSFRLCKALGVHSLLVRQPCRGAVKSRLPQLLEQSSRGQPSSLQWPVDEHGRGNEKEKEKARQLPWAPSDALGFAAAAGLAAGSITTAFCAGEDDDGDGLAPVRYTLAVRKSCPISSPAHHQGT